MPGVVGVQQSWPAALRVPLPVTFQVALAGRPVGGKTVTFWLSASRKLIVKQKP